MKLGAIKRNQHITADCKLKRHRQLRRTDMDLEPLEYSLAGFKPEAVKKARTDSGQSQRALSQVIKVNQSIWSQWESGSRRPSRAQLRQLCELFEKPESFFCGELDARLLS